MGSETRRNLELKWIYSPYFQIREDSFTEDKWQSSSTHSCLSEAESPVTEPPVTDVVRKPVMLMDHSSQG